MRRWYLALLSAASISPVIAADVGVSISVGEPGFYGRIDIGEFPRPVLVYPQPVIIRPVAGIVYTPIYLHVPPGHAKDWGKHCGKYNACGERVFFVQDHWYNDVYVPQYKAKHGKGNHSNGKGQGNQKDKGKD
jgi:hypothetical protein